MSLVPLETLPDEARVWCFGASRALEDDEQSSVVDSMSGFIEQWTAHRKDLRAALDVLHGRFMIVAVDESVAGASGCSLDALMRQLREIGHLYDADWLDSEPVWYRDTAGQIQSVGREAFRAMASRGEVSDRTSVFDLTISRLADLRAGRLEAGAGMTWHRRLLPTG
jgi:hypothetical protein